jgi:uncharacterized protein YkwD
MTRGRFAPTLLRRRGAHASARTSGQVHATLPLHRGTGLAAAALLTACTPEVNAEMTTYRGINAIRKQAGLPPLIPDVNLVKIARIRSADITANGYFSHYPPNGCNFLCLMDQYGISHAWSGENLDENNWNWSQTADRAVQGWKNSPPHLENILNCHYQGFGTGVVTAADGMIYYTMILEGAATC